MKVLTLFRVLRGVKCRLADSFLCPALEVLSLGFILYLPSDVEFRTFSGFLYTLGWIGAIVTGNYYRRWILRRSDAIEGYFETSSRSVSYTEFATGFVYILLVGRTLHYNIMANWRLNVPISVFLGDMLLLYYASFSYLRICFILQLLLADVNCYLEQAFSEVNLTSLKQCCVFLESVNLLLDGIQDHILFYSCGWLVLSVSLATLSACDLLLNLAAWISHFTVPLFILVGLGERISGFMYAKRVRLRRRWPTEKRIIELHAMGGHRNSSGLLWIAKSECLNYATSLPVMANVFAYAGLILTTPVFLSDGTYDIFCGT